MVGHQCHLHRLQHLQRTGLEAVCRRQRRRRGVFNRQVDRQQTAVAMLRRGQTGKGPRRRHGIGSMHPAKTDQRVVAVRRHRRMLGLQRAQIGRPGGARQQPAHIAPGQGRVGLQHERHHPRDHRRRRRGAAGKGGVVGTVGLQATRQAPRAGNVGGPDVGLAFGTAQQAHRRCADQHIGAGLGVGWWPAPVVDRPHRQHARLVGIAVAVAVVIGAPVAGGKHHHCATALASLRQGPRQRLAPGRIRRLVADALPGLRVQRAPAVVDNVGPKLYGRAQRCRHAALGQAIKCEKTRLGCHAPPAQAVVGTGHRDADHRRAMGIVPFTGTGVVGRLQRGWWRRWVGRGQPAVDRVQIGHQIRVPDLHCAIDKGHQHAETGLGHALQTEVHARYAAMLAGVEQVPLTRQQGVRAGHAGRHGRCGQVRPQIATATATGDQQACRQRAQGQGPENGSHPLTPGAGRPVPAHKRSARGRFAGTRGSWARHCACRQARLRAHCAADRPAPCGRRPACG